MSDFDVIGKQGSVVRGSYPIGAEQFGYKAEAGSVGTVHAVRNFDGWKSYYMAFGRSFGYIPASVVEFKN